MDFSLAEGISTPGIKLPGIMSIAWVPSFGNSSEPTDPASIAGKEFYGRVRAAYSGALDADAPDFMVYLGALDSIFSYIGWLKRLYRAISTYSPDNMLLPEYLLGAMGVKTTTVINNLRQHKTRLWQGINELILMSRKFRCPAVMDLFNRHYWMSDNVYADAPTTRAQLYVFNLVGVYKLAEQTEVSSGTESVMGLQLTKLPTNFTVDELITFGLQLLQAFDAWDDSYTISGYLTRAFDSVPSFQVAELLQDELITAQFVPEVLSQIENLRSIQLGSTSAAIGDPIWTSFFAANKVTQNVATNAVVSNVNFSYTDQTATAASATNPLYANVALFNRLPKGVSPMINVRSDAPTVADTVIASRLQAYTTISAPEYVEAKKATLNYEITGGTELVLWIGLISKTSSTTFLLDGLAQVYANAVTYKTAASDPSTTKFSHIENAANNLLEQFAWHPFVFAVDALSTSDSDTRVYPQGDVYNATKVTPEMLANLHKICFYSELNSFSI